MPILENATYSIKNYSRYFDWFNTELSAAIQPVMENFWQVNVNLRLFSMEKNSKEFFSGNNYFVTQANYHSVKCTLRISDTFCERILTQALGSNNSKRFVFSELTELEANLISKSNNLVFDNIKQHFITPKEIKGTLYREENFDDTLNLGVIAYDSNNEFEMGKFFFSIPIKLLNFPDLPPLQEDLIDVTKFKKALTPVDIFVGKTKLSLEDIQNIEADDIVLLEKSYIREMAVTAPTFFKFKINPDPRLFIKGDDEEENTVQQEDYNMSTKDIWDNVQVDVNAKFHQVKMSLGELREMAEGVVVELDSIYGNEIVLEVENKHVAKGELVIIGDKYGVKITEIYSEPETSGDEETAEETQNSNDEFDVNDFEIKE